MQLNPTRAEIATAAALYADKGAKEVADKLKKRIGEIESVHGQLAENYAWSKVTKLQGTDDDKRNAFRLMNADCAALRDRMREIQQLDANTETLDRAAEIVARNGGSRPANPVDRAEAQRLAAMPPSDLERYQMTRFLRVAAEEAGIELAGPNEDGREPSIVTAIADRTNGVSKLRIPLDMLVGPRQPLNVLTGGSSGMEGGGTTPGADGGFSIYPPMSDLTVALPFPPTMVMDKVRRVRTGSNSFVYRAQTSGMQLVVTDADAAAAAKAGGWTAENNAGAEIKPKWETQTSPVVKCLAYAQVTEEQVEDGEDVDMLIADQLRRELRNSVERDLLLGTGSNNRTNGLFGVAGFTDVAYANPGANLTSYGMDEISKGIFTVMKDVWMMPDCVVMHPLDWHELSTTRDDQGRLQFMDPTEAAAQRIFGLPVVFTPWMKADLTQGNVGIGAFGTAALIADRRDVMLARTDAHDQNFTKDVMTIKANVRLAVARLYNQGFYRVTDFKGKRQGA